MSDPHDPPLRDVSVLVVDDQEETRYAVGAYLRHFGAHVETAASGADALTYLATARAHVLVIDYDMPGMNGFDLLARIRKMPGEGEQRTPAILYTAADDLAEAARAAGFDGYLVKPLAPRLLVAEIERLARG